MRVEARTKELRESEERFSTAFHASPTPTTISRLSDHRYLDVNESFLQLTGYERDEVIGRTIGDLKLLLDTEQRDQSLYTLCEGQDAAATENRLRTKAGDIRYGLVARRVITLNGEPCALSTFVDITDRKRTEQDMMQALQAVMQDTTSLTRSVMEKLAQIKADGEDGAELAELTDRERQVLERVAKGMNNKKIGEALDIGPQTVRNYIATIYQKINVHSRAEAVVWARERGLGGY